MARNWCAGPRLVILYFSDNLALILIAAVVVSSECNHEMSLMYKSIGMPLLQRERGRGQLGTV